MPEVIIEIEDDLWGPFPDPGGWGAGWTSFLKRQTLKCAYCGVSVRDKQLRRHPRLWGNNFVCRKCWHRNYQEENWRDLPKLSQVLEESMIMLD